MVHVPIKKIIKVYTSVRDVDFYKSTNIENSDSQHFLLLFLAALEFNAVFLQYSNIYNISIKVSVN